MRWAETLNEVAELSSASNLLILQIPAICSTGQFDGLIWSAGCHVSFADVIAQASNLRLANVCAQTR